MVGPTPRYIPHARRKSCLALVAAVFAVCACSPEEAEKPESPATPRDGTAIDAAEAKHIITSYKEFRELQVDLWTGERTLEEAEDDLRDRASGKALTETKESLVFLEEQGAVLTGEPAMSPEVTALNTDVSPSAATLQDCWDTSDMPLIDEKTGKSQVDPDQSERVVVTAHSEQDETGQWVWTELVSDFDRSC